MNDDQLLQAYNAGFATSHMAGLRAVVSAVLAEVNTPQTDPVPATDESGVVQPTSAGKWV
jgi:hypothetical protein